MTAGGTNVELNTWAGWMLCLDEAHKNMITAATFTYNMSGVACPLQHKQLVLVVLRKHAAEMPCKVMGTSRKGTQEMPAAAHVCGSGKTA